MLWLKEWYRPNIKMVVTQDKYIVSSNRYNNWGKVKNSSNTHGHIKSLVGWSLSKDKCNNETNAGSGWGYYGVGDSNETFL